MNAYIVSRDALTHNIRTLKNQANGVPIWAVIKGDGYGLGALPLAELLREEGIANFCVTEVREAEILRENGFAEENILMLRAVSDRETIHRLLDLRVILTVGSLETAKLVNETAIHRADVAQVHIKLDTGMGRYGFLPEDMDSVKAVYRECKQLAVCGIYTHFNCAFADEKLTREEFAVFQRAIEQIRADGLETGTVHCCNSSAFLRFPEMYCDGVRLGSAILGRMPFRTKLRPVGYLQSEIEELRTLPKGHTTGYGAIWKAKKDTPVAIIPVGWFHGLCVRGRIDQSRAIDCLRQAFSALKGILRRKRDYVEINGKRCPIIGAIGMLHCAVDVSGVECQKGDKVKLQVNPLHLKAVDVVFKE